MSSSQYCLSCSLSVSGLDLSDSRAKRPPPLVRRYGHQSFSDDLTQQILHRLSFVTGTVVILTKTAQELPRYSFRASHPNSAEKVREVTVRVLSLLLPCYRATTTITPLQQEGWRQLYSVTVTFQKSTGHSYTTIESPNLTGESGKEPASNS